MYLLKLKLVKGIYFFSFSLVVFFTISCSSTKNINKDFVYFQKGLDSLGTVKSKEIVLKTNDIISIRVGSRSLNQEQTRIFNMGAGDSTNVVYTVNPVGYIEMPVIGDVKAAGLTTMQLQTLLAYKLKDYVKDPLVKVKYAQFNVNVLGEVKNPGTKIFNGEYVTVIDAISASGDLTDFGKREDILVIREENGVRKYYTIDLKNATFYRSPAYQLQPNDLVYVPANNIKLTTLNRDPDKGKGISVLVQIAGLAALITNIVINARR